MPDFKVTFRGDLGNLAQFDASVRNSMRGAADAVRQVNAQIASQVGKLGNNLSVFKGEAVIDSVNNTFKQSGQIVRRFVKDYRLEMDNLGKVKLSPVYDTVYQSSFKQAIGNVKQYEAALKQMEPVFRQYENNVRNFYENARVRANLVQQLEVQKSSILDDPTNAQKRVFLTSAVDNIQQRLDRVTSGTSGVYGAAQTSQIKKLTADLTKAQQALAAFDANIKGQVASIEATIKRLNNLNTVGAKRLARELESIKQSAGYGRVVSAANATPPIQSTLASVLRESESLRKKLVQGGLGQGTQYGTEEFQKALAKQEAAVTSYTRNLRTGVRTVQGEFIGLGGIANKFTVDLDDNGKVIGRWGGQLSGAGSILRQTVRDFQKVIEWTVATTVVFGSLALVAGQFQNINELNNSLARFSITAQTSAEETRGIFEDLARVAYETATPLNNLVKVADDIALATRVAGQSTEEWKADILELSTAVGIFTNLTGTETVEAADQLSSAFKQLGIAPQELVGVLSKVTAVAGGQAGAIADIVKALSTVSEASRAAGLSVDEQIASVQVLSQVTNKSASEVATAFKNLFGSVSSVGSEKILESFGIAIRDETGGLKGFLDIYREVAAALEAGVIPQNRLPDVLRGISGGPRRAPDAAALLSNLGRIDEVVAISANASNEALVANAKILDTNQAKIIQFQNSINTIVFEKFGKAVEDLVSILTELGTTLATAFNGVDANLVNLVLKLGLVVTGIRVLGSLTKLVFGGVFSGAIGSIKGMTSALFAAGQQAKITQQQLSIWETTAGSIFPPAAPNATGLARLKNVVGGNKLAIGAGIAGAGAAVAAGAGGIDSTTIGTFLQMGGAVATLIPGLQGVGVAAIIAGTAVQLLGGNSGETAKSAADLSAEIYTLTQNIQNSQRESDTFARTQKDALKVINTLSNGVADTAEEQAQLQTATKDYVTATLGMANANEAVSKSFDELLAKLKVAGSDYETFVQTVNKGTDVDSPAFRALQAKLASDILKNSGQGIYAGGPIDFASTFRPAIQTPATKSGKPIDITRLIEDPAFLKELLLQPRGKGTFDPSVLGPTAGVVAGDFDIQIIQGALAQLSEDFKAGKGNITEEELTKLTNAVTLLAGAASSFTQNAVALAQQNALIQAKIITGEFTGAQGENALLANKLASTLNTAIAGNPAQPKGVSPEERDAAAAINQKNLELIATLGEKAATGAALTNQELINVATTILSLNSAFGDLAKVGETALNEAIVQTLQAAGVSGTQLDTIMKNLAVTLKTLPEAVVDLAPLLDSARQKAAQNYGERALQLEIGQNSGEFEKNAAGLATLVAQNEAAYQSNLQLIDSLTQLSGSAFVDLNNSLAQVIGLQGEWISETELLTLTNTVNEEGISLLQERQAELGEKLIENAVKAGVNAEGIKEITKQVGILIGTIAAIPTYKKIIVDIQTRINSSGQAGTDSQGTLQDEKALRRYLEKQKKSEESGAGSAAQKKINDIIKDIQNAIKSGSGSGLGAASKGAGSKGASYNKPGLLDIPDEVMDQANYRKLLAEAIAKARALQGDIPGESKANKNDIVALLDGTRKILQTRGIGEEYLRRALDELTEQIKKQNEFLTKADTIRRIRFQSGSFASIANVPLNSKTGVSLGGAEGPINISLNLNGSVLTPAQFAQFADMVAAALKKQLAG